MKASDNALRLITSAEGFKSSPYLDTSRIYTVGWGYALKTPGGQNIDVDVFGSKAPAMAQDAMQRKFGAQSITQDQADECLKEIMASSEAFITSHVPSNTTQNQFDALLSFEYNVGSGNYLASAVHRLHDAGNRSVGQLSLIATCAASKAKENPTSIALAFGRWSNSGGMWTLGLFRRRMAEVLVYSGWEADKAVPAAWAFHD